MLGFQFDLIMMKSGIPSEYEQSGCLVAISWFFYLFGLPAFLFVLYQLLSSLRFSSKVQRKRCLQEAIYQHTNITNFSKVPSWSSRQDSVRIKAFLAEISIADFCSSWISKFRKPRRLKMVYLTCIFLSVGVWLVCFII